MHLARSHVPHIDGLRAIAVLSVLLYHLNPALVPGGFTGVDVFFVISGFVVSGSVAGQQGTSLRGFLGYFYARRLVRIAPALIVCLLVTSLMFALWVPTALTTDAMRRAGSAAFFGLSNFSLSRTAHDYFASGTGFNAFTQTWSLAVEEQFYLIFPWIFLPFLRGRQRLAIALAGLGLALSLLDAYLRCLSESWLAFYLITSRFWELAIGVLLYQAGARLQTESDAPLWAPWLPPAGVLLAMLCLAWALWTTTPDMMPFPGGLLPCLATAGLLGLLPQCRAGFAVRRVLEHPVARFIGKISYSLYLWHWPVFVLFRWTVGLQTWLWQAAALAITVVLAVASYQLVEAPPRRWVHTATPARGKIVAGGLLLLAAAYGLNQGIWALQPVISLSRFEQHQMDWYPDGANQDPAHLGCTITATRLKLPTGPYQLYVRSGCAEAVTWPHHLFVLGDSHSAAYAAMLKRVTLRTGATTSLYWLGGCAFVALDSVPGPDCDSYDRGAVADIFKQARPGDIVFLASRRMPKTPFDPATRLTAASVWQAVLQRFAAHGLLVVLEAPTPEYNSPLFRCVDWYDKMNPSCQGEVTDKAAFEQQRAPVLALYATFQQSVPHVVVWDPAALLCDATQCSQMRGDKPLYYDGDHLSGFAGTLLEPDFEALLHRLAS